LQSKSSASSDNEQYDLRFGIQMGKIFTIETKTQNSTEVKVAFEADE